jgi:hypothetical protein
LSEHSPAEEGKLQGHTTTQNRKQTNAHAELTCDEPGLSSIDEKVPIYDGITKVARCVDTTMRDI